MVRRAVVATVLLSLAWCGTAAADSATISFTNAAGASDPVAGVGRTATVSGTTSAPLGVWVKWRPSGGAPCAPSVSSDSGESWFSGSWSGRYTGADVNGNFALKTTGTWGRPGTFMFCIWLATNESQSVTPITQVVTFRSPSATVSATVNPVSPKVDESATLTVTGASEAPKEVFATIRPAGGAPCAASYGADSGTGLIRDKDVNGNFSVTATFSSSTPGSNLICLWVADSQDDGSPVAGPQPITFDVIAPAPPCVVPSITAGSPLPNVLDLLARASCAAGKRSYIASRRYARGTVIKLKTSSGTSLTNGSRVDLLLSSGRPCVVPSTRSGRLRLSTARRRLSESGCTPGAVIRRRSRRVGRGRVIAFKPGAGSTLSPRTSVDIVVSRGRR